MVDVQMNELGWSNELVLPGHLLGTAVQGTARSKGVQVFLLQLVRAFVLGSERSESWIWLA